MRGPLLFPLPASHRNLFIKWSQSPDEDPIRARNSEILILLDDGHHSITVSERFGLSRQWLPEVVRPYLVFGPDGIKTHVPRLGRKSIFTGGRGRTILEIALNERSIEEEGWKRVSLAKRCDAPYVSLSRMLNRKGIDLKDLTTIQRILFPPEIHPSGMAGIIGNYSMRAIAFWRATESSNNGAAMISRSPPMDTKNTQAFLSKQLHQLDSNFCNIGTKRPSRTCSKMHDHRDILRFAAILNEKCRGQRKIGLIVGSEDLDLMLKLVRYIEGHPALQLHVDLGGKSWVDYVRGRIDAIDDWNQRRISLRLENTNIVFDRWRHGPRRKLGTFAWLDNTW